MTFINPQPEKGAGVFAGLRSSWAGGGRIFRCWSSRAAGKADGLAGLPVDLSGLTNLNRMANTPDPRDFYRVSRVVLMPSLWRESLGRVPIEAMANGIPVLASDRGACPRLSAMPASCSQSPIGARRPATSCPRRRKSRPWVAVIERLWDDPEFEAEHRRRAKAEAVRWDSDRLAEQYEMFFETARPTSPVEATGDCPVHVCRRPLAH